MTKRLRRFCAFFRAHSRTSSELSMNARRMLKTEDRPETQSGRELQIIMSKSRIMFFGAQK